MTEGSDLFYWQIPPVLNGNIPPKANGGYDHYQAWMRNNLAKARSAWLEEETEEEKFRRYCRGNRDEA